MAKKNTMEKLVCECCGAEFIGKVLANGYRRKTCSDRCMGNAKLTCECCGEEFVGKVHSNGYRRRTCSAKCMAKLGREKMAENKASGSKSTIDIHKESIAHAQESIVQVRPNKNSVYRRVHRYARAWAAGKPIELWQTPPNQCPLKRPQCSDGCFFPYECANTVVDATKKDGVN